MRETRDSNVAWIGAIPAHWEIRRGKNILTLLERPIKNDDGVITCFRDGEVTLRSKRREEGFTFSFQEAGYQGIEPGDLVVHGMDGFAGAIGISDSRGKATPVLNVLDSTQNKRFIMYYLRSMAYNGVFLSLSTGIRVRSCDTNWNKLKNLPYIIPSIQEQDRIAVFLDYECREIDSLVSRTKESITEYKKLKQAVISQAVTKGIRSDRGLVSSGLTWVPELPGEWRIIPSKYLFRNSDLRKQPGDEQLTASQKYGIISQREYMERENSKIVLANKGIDDWKHVEPYDFVISLRSFQGGLEMSETTGCITWHYIVLKPCKPIVSKYYKWLFKSEVYIKALQRTCNFIRDGQDLRYSNFVQVPLFEPPLAEQQEIADYLDRKCAEIDRLIAQKEQLLTEIENYKKTLIYEYVTGKKEVPAEQTAPVVTFIDARALLVCRIVELMKPKGRIHLQKAMHMVDCLLGLNNETQYSRHKHGPYDVRIQEYEQAAEHKGWIKVKQGSSVEYSAGAKIEEYRDAYLSMYGDVDAEIQKICAFLAPMKTSQSERVATLLAAWNDFLLDGVNPTDQQLIQEVRTNWTPNKANSPEATWLDTLNKIRKNGFVPAGKGLRTITAG